MPDLITRVTSIPFDYTCSVSDSSKSVGFPLVLRDNNSSTPRTCVIFELNIGTSGDFATYFGGADKVYDVTKVEIEFWHNYANSGPVTGNPLYTVNFNSVDDSRRPSTHSTAIDLLNDVEAGDSFLANYRLNSTQKTLERVTLGSSSSDTVCNYVKTRIQAEDWIAIGLMPYNPSTTGDAEIGNMHTLIGSGYWREADGSEIASPPNIIITWQELVNDRARLSMRYTTADPTTAQNTPSNSIGGYIAPNSVYAESKINEFLDSTQNYVQLSSDATIPEQHGLVQIGPEIMRYNAVNSSSKQLLSITRGVSPENSFPSSIVPTRELVHFLEIDKLFDTKPTSQLVQYRCVALVVENNPIANVSVYLRQSSNNSVQTDIGIEIPEYDIREDVLDAAISGSNIFTMSGSSLTHPLNQDLLEAGSDLYVGGYAVVDYDGEADMVKIESFDVNDEQTQGTFIVDRALTYDAGTKVRILPAPAQRFTNDTTAPSSNSGRFLGFFSESGLNHFNQIRDGGTVFREQDAFYIWIKRTLYVNNSADDTTGSVIYVRYEQGDAS